MLSIFVPDIYQKSIFDINYKKLKNNGIKFIIFDLDNTIAPVNIKSPNKKVKDLMAELEEDFKLIIMSNAGKKRVEPFKDILGIDSAYFSFKPFKRKYKKIMNIYKFKDTETAVVGDQLLTDILGGNRLGFTTILVNPMGILDYALTKINRFIENTIYNHLEKKDLLKRGEYYD